MKIKCLHGYFIITETKHGQVSDFMTRFGLPIVPKNDYYTFEPIEFAPDYSLAGKDLLGLPAIKTFEGQPWEVFEANGFVFDLSTGLLAPIDSIVQKIRIDVAGNRFISNGLILPGSITDEGARVKDYAAWFSRATYKFTYTEITYV